MIVDGEDLERNVAEPVVEVLLATYNGERFLREQLDSILAQTYRNFRILARDDGSVDGTADLLRDYAARFPAHVRLIEDGERSGGAKWNFLRLMRSATAPYVAMCDQDDVWIPEKIALEMRSMRELESRHGPAMPLLVFSDLRVVSDDLQTVADSFWQQQDVTPSKIEKLSSLLVQNVVTGCTCLLNRPLLRLAIDMPATAYMHDWWIALVASVFGRSAWRDEKTVLYRQHGGNVLGAPVHGKTRGIPRWRYHEKRKVQWEMGEQQAEGLLAVFADRLPEEAHKTIDAYVSCEHSASRFLRVSTLLRHRFLVGGGLRANLAIIWYLWDMDAAKRH